jgi:hypothetical protein
MILIQDMSLTLPSDVVREWPARDELCRRRGRTIIAAAPALPQAMKKKTAALKRVLTRLSAAWLLTTARLYYGQLTPDSQSLKPVS